MLLVGLYSGSSCPPMLNQATATHVIPSHFNKENGDGKSGD